MSKKAYESIEKPMEQTYDLFLGTLCNKYRLAIIDLLRKKSFNVSQITNALQLNQTTVSHNLARLKKCGFVTNQQRGAERIYTLNTETIEPLMKIINRHIKKYCNKRCKP